MDFKESLRNIKEEMIKENKPKNLEKEEKNESLKEKEQRLMAEFLAFIKDEDNIKKIR